ncbi:MAG: 50S ribosomal protein L22 [Actinomycetota bacterium]
MSPTITGTRAQARFVRMSAKKVRPVLDLVRGEPIGTADEILQFTPREAARAVRKVLKSAAANAVNNDGLPLDELFVAACYADEGPTIKRFRPRARGRATRINKRTCHITVVVDRMPAEELERFQQRQAASGQSGAAAAARARRVAASRGEEVADDEVTEDEVDETAEAEATDVIDTDVVEEAEVVDTDVVEDEEVDETEVVEVVEDEEVEEAAAEPTAEADDAEPDDDEDDETKKDDA